MNEWIQSAYKKPKTERDSLYDLGVLTTKYICRHDGTRWRIFVNYQKLRK